MPTVVTINRPDVVQLIETAAQKLTNGNKTELIAKAVRSLLDSQARGGPLFGAHAGSVQTARGVDLTAPSFSDMPDAQTGRELLR